MEKEGASDTPRSSEKKRVRFKQEAEIREFESHETSKKARVILQQFAIEDLEGEISAVNIDSSSDDPHHRRRPIFAATRGLFSHSGKEEEEEDKEDIEGAETDWDVFQADAEIDYEQPDQLLNEAGIPIEPFHLKEERESGYFDSLSGSYIQLKKKEDVDDAWADALEATEVDPGWAQAVIDRASAREAKARKSDNGFLGGGGGGGGGFRGGGIADSDLSIEDIIELKQHIVSLLHPGENVLAALRRLGKSRAPEEAKAMHISSLSSVAEGQRGGEGQMSPLEERHGGSTLEKKKGGEKTRQEQHIDPNSNKNQQQEQQPQTGGVQKLRRATLTPQAQLEFDQLTDWSSVLMETGEFLIHSQTREELLHSIEKAGNTTDQGSNRAEEFAIAGRSEAVDQVEGNLAESRDQDDIDMFAAEEDLKDAKIYKLETEENDEDAPCTLPQEEHPLQQQQQPRQDKEEENAALQNLGDPLLQGFILDQSSGYYYNSSLGAYYDPASSLFGDAASGRWYKLDESSGQYILV